MDRGLLILVVVILVLAVARLMWASYLNYRHRVMYHRERMFALEKGVEPPPMPPSLAGPHAEGWGSVFQAGGAPASPSAYLLRGLVWLFLGIGIMGFFAGISTTFIREKVPDWYYSQKVEDRKLPPPTVRNPEVPMGWTTLGLIPAGVGIAYLIFYRVESRRRKAEPPEKA